MRRFFILLLISTSTFSLVSCDKDTKKESEVSVSSDTNISDPIIEDTTQKNFLLSDSSISPSPFLIKDSVLFFPNWDDNNKIASISFPEKSLKFTNKDVGEFFPYSTNSMVLFQNQIFFANGNDNFKFYKLNLTNKSVSSINHHSTRDLCTDNINIYYVDYKTNELFSYDALENSSTKLTTNKVGKILINGKNILYQNLDDNSRLYRVSTDGVLNEKLTDYSVDSFTSYEKNIYFINSSDNNHLYSLNPSTLDTTRVAIIEGKDLTALDKFLFYIDIKDGNKLKTITLDLKENTFSTKILLDDSINNYYLSDKGIFYRKSIDVNSAYYYLEIK
ncbi:MAG: DUF5050 domain-containing protein [Clostridium sp.]